MDKKQYMAAYRLANPEKWKRTPEQQAAVNARRRELYSLEEPRRVEARKQARAWQVDNPEKRKAQRLKPYGLTLAQFRSIMKAQNDACAICGMTDQSKPNRFPLVDHCHTTKAVRGLLCMQCNQALGKFNDNPDLLRKAADYLDASRSPGLSGAT